MNASLLTIEEFSAVLTSEEEDSQLLTALRELTSVEREKVVEPLSEVSVANRLCWI